MTDRIREYQDERFADLIGHRIKTIELGDTDDTMTLYFTDRGPAYFQVEGDCCSKSWIEHLEVPGTMANVDAQLLWVEDGGEITQDHEGHDDGGDLIQVYNTHFYTDKGTITLEYRNSSNGYYGGSLVRVGKFHED